VAAAVAATIVAAVLVQGRAPVPAPAPVRPASPARPPNAAGGLAVFQLPAGAAVGGPAGSGRDVLLMAARTAASAPLSRPAR
jgi:hypothetical protein